MEIYGHLKEKRPEILHTAAEHGARNVRIFGSITRGEAKAASDVDLQDLLGSPVDVVTEKGL